MPLTQAALEFSTTKIQAALTRPDETIPLHDETLVVNLSAPPLRVDTAVSTVVPPLQSAILNQVTLRHPASLLLLTGWQDEQLDNLGRREGWRRIGDDPALAAGAGDGAALPAATPLWRSPIAELGAVSLPPDMLGATSMARSAVSLRLQANLWYAPAQTDCHIHRKHDFLEVHTQVAGRGRMQKFHAQDETTLYQDVPLEPGTTHAPFGFYDIAGTWRYPWHRYWSDADCVWLALEYHPH